MLCGVESFISAQGEYNRITQCDSVYMVRHPRGSYIVYSLLSLEAATPENKSINWALLPTCNKSPPQQPFFEGCSSPSCDSPNTSRRFELGASNVCLVGENPACSVPAL